MNTSYTLTFAGDTSLGDWYLKKPGKEHLLDRLKKEPFSYFTGVKPLVENSDYLILNLETVLEDDPKPILKGKGYPNYDNPKRTLKALKDLGATAVNLANNHTMDFGDRILLKTLKRLKKGEIQTLGAGKNKKDAATPLKIVLEGKKGKKNIYIFTGMQAGKQYRKYGFFAEDKKTGIYSLPRKGLSKQISNLREKDPESIIIVYPHWQGHDYKKVSDSLRIKERCRAFIDAGANYIFGHGTHMMDEVEHYNGGTIAYSIGNFVFNSPGRYKKLQAPPYSLVVNMDIQENKDGTWTINNKFYPIMTDNQLTDFNVQKIDINEVKNFAYEVEKDQRGLFIKDTVDQSVNDMLETMIGKKPISQLNFNDIDSIENQIIALKKAQEQIYNNLNNYYSKLTKHKLMKNLEKNNFHLYERLADTIKQDFVTYGMYRKFGKRKLNITDSISFQNIIVQNGESKRLGNPYYAQMLDKKITAYEFADKVGFRRPYTDPKIYKFSELEPQKGPVVVKPTSATGAMGVYLIYSDNYILSAREGKVINSWNELVNDVKMKKEQDKDRVRKYFKKDAWMVEELIVDPNSPKYPTDLKFYTFYGEVMLILEINRNGEDRYQFWNADHEKMVTGAFDQEHQILHDAKGFNKKDLDKIIRFSLEIPAPFMRIDMIQGDNELVFGEATYYPGGFHTYNAEWDRKLGEAYINAEARLKSDLLNGKEFNHFKSLFKV
ncbi:CapA family protein [Amphibacillus sp. Q70]|uniref:CapA family protein n=1 Tax=Amphibacillus sp. Q70 TaxID=3453416 RepID=UPI003F849907